METTANDVVGANAVLRLNRTMQYGNLDKYKGEALADGLNRTMQYGNLIRYREQTVKITV